MLWCLMRITPESLETIWYEDGQGNKCCPGSTHFPATPSIPNGLVYQHSRMCVIRHSIYASGGKGPWHPVAESESTWDTELVEAMLKFGGHDLHDAIIIAGTCCERCLNALLYKYLNKGYPEYSEEWLASRTECEFCKYMEPTKNTVLIDVEARITLAKIRTGRYPQV